MKQAMIYKGCPPEELTEGDLAKINRYTRRELKAEELYVFPLILCDNEIDRDFERFSVDALARLKRLFLGKTGIFDHNPKGENQTARIFDTAVEKDAMRTTGTGELYHFLTAKAYMVRSDKNRDLILDIDAGIKKEVSVGCAVAEVICSVCGANIKDKPCGHVSGREYDGKACHYTLQKPTDAYEWSFVAVPAQPAAGVTKAYEGAERCQSLDELCERLISADGGVTLQYCDARALGGALKSALLLAKEGESCRDKLKKELMRDAALGGFISAGAARDIAEKLNTDELRELKKTFARLSGRTSPPFVQTGVCGAGIPSAEASDGRSDQNTSFKI